MEDGKQGSAESPETKTSTWELLVSNFVIFILTVFGNQPYKNRFQPSRPYKIKVDFK